MRALYDAQKDLEPLPLPAPFTSHSPAQHYSKFRLILTRFVIVTFSLGCFFSLRSLLPGNFGHRNIDEYHVHVHPWPIEAFRHHHQHCHNHSALNGERAERIFL